MANIYNKLMTIQGALKAPKGQYNSFGKYKYRSCEDILESVKPLLSAHDCALVITDDIMMIGDRIYVKATAKLISGSEQVESSAFAREESEKRGMDSSQVTGAASSYARKYALNGLFCIDDTKDSDATNTHGQQPKEEPKKEEPKNTQPKMQPVYDEISNAQTIDQLKAIHKKYPHLKDNKEFVAALTNKKSAINNGL
jgi:hypothetical protein